MRVLIVDDEALARAKLRRMLSELAGVQVVAEAAAGSDALALIPQCRPDVMFLDVQMPEFDGFEVAASLPDHGPAVVFVTAFDRYALRAFDTGAIDYLLKPIEPERLERAVVRLRGGGRGGTRPAVPLERLLVADRGQTHVIPCSDIEWLEAADNYVNVHFRGHSVLMRRTLESLLADLAPRLVRTHRGAAVALASVAAVRPRGRGDATILLRSGAEVPCSRQYRALLMQRLTGLTTGSPRDGSTSSRGDGGDGASKLA